MARNKHYISPFSVIVTFVCLAIIGIALIPFLSIQLYPVATSPSLTVNFYWPDASARVIEREVTAKLEGVFAAVRGIKSISSVSSKGSGRIDLIFMKGINQDAVRFEIASLIRRCYPDFPPDVSYPDLSINNHGERSRSLLSFSIIAVVDTHIIGKYVENEILPVLSEIKGVDEVVLFGATPYQMEVKFHLEQIKVLGITGDEIEIAINTHFARDLLGRGSYQESVFHNGKLTIYLGHSMKETVAWPDIPVKKVGHRIVYLKDIAEVRYREKLPNSYYRINGLNTVNLVIYPEKGVNNITVAKTLREKAQQIRENLPAGYSILLTSDSTEYLKNEIDKIVFRTVLSLSILLTFIFAISRRWRYLLIVVVSVAANLIIACIFFYILKIELQLYSLAGFTISIGLVIDNSIIMIDHIRNTGKKRVRLALFAATLTTIAALGVIFFLPEQERLNLLDFAWVIIINLLVSLAVASFLIPALIGPRRFSSSNQRSYTTRRLVVKFTWIYEKSLICFSKLRWVFIIALILAFGVPVQWLPNKINSYHFFTNLYNGSLGSVWFREDVKPYLNEVFGGTIILFTENVLKKSYYPEPRKTVLHVTGTMAEGHTVQQLNTAIAAMETFISKFDEVEMFETSISSFRNSHIMIHFRSGYERNNFPNFLKSQIELKAIDLGGVDWKVFGVGLGFSNAISENTGNRRIILEGYNYDQLYQYAELLKRHLLENQRIKEVAILGADYWNVQPFHEFFLSFNSECLGLNDVLATDFYSALKDKSYRKETNSYFNGAVQDAYIISDSYDSFSVWDYNHIPFEADKKLIKMVQFGTIDKRRIGNDISRFDQQYRLVVAYDFIGPYMLADLVDQQHIEKFTDQILPLGFSINKNQYQGWNRENPTQYYLIGLVIIVIYFIAAILLESLVQPLAVIALLPIAFIGVFLTFYSFGINFDQGGFASFILLSGIAVNGGLYILNDFNNLCQLRKPNLKAYLKAFNYKIIPLALTILSTILGLIPFLIGQPKEVFWFAFAAGTAGGLGFSLIGILIYLPLFLGIGKTPQVNIKIPGKFV
jgi:multidrug efflux pump subunit AcrB